MKTVFSVRVLTKDMISDTFAKWKSVIGGRIKRYERLIAEGLEDAYSSLLEKYPNVKNIRFGTTEIMKDGCEIIIYGEVTDEEYERQRKSDKS